MSDFKKELRFHLASLWSLRCLFHRDCEKFSLSVDSDTSGNIILHQTDRNYIIHIKNDERYSKKLTVEELLSSSGDYSLLACLNDISTLRSLEFKKDNLAVVNKFKIPADNNCFIFYTNKAVDHCEIVDKICDEFPNFLDNNNDLMCKINFGKIPKALELSKECNLNCGYLCINQNSIEKIRKDIMGEISQVLIDTEQDIQGVAQEFITFISTNLIKHNYITKQDILYKFVQIVFLHNQINLDGEDVLSFPPEKLNIWNEIIHDKILTIVQSDDEIMKFLLQYIQSEVRKFCKDADFKTWTEHLSMEEIEIINKCFEGKIFSKKVETYLDVYTLLVISKKLPLLLDINESQDYKHILNVLKLLNYPFKIILVTKNLQFQTEFNGEDRFRIFVSLQDLNEEERRKFFTLSVKLQGRETILGNLLDKTSYSFVKCNEIIKILLGGLHIGNQLKLSENLVQRSFSRVFIELRVLDEIQDETFLIEDSENCFNSLIIKNTNVSHLEETNSLKPGIILTQNRIIIEQLGIFKSKTCAIHHLSIHNTRYLEWKNSFGSIENIKKFQIQLEDVEKDMRNNFSKVVTIINGAAGMGKSTFMDIVAEQAPPNKWVLRVDLNKHQNYYKSFQNANVLEHLMYFQDFHTNGCNNELDEKVFNKMVQSKDVIVFLDGFDEISVCYKEEVTNIAKLLHQEGYQIWISTRPVMKLYLEDIFNTFSVDLKPFTNANQKYVLSRYFKKLINGSEILIEDFVKKLLEMAEKNLKGDQAEFIGIPLHTKLLADAFENECKSYVCCNGAVTVRETFDLLYLYQSYVENRITVLCDKFHALKQSDRIMFKEHQSLFALKLLFPFHDHQEVDKEVEYYRNKPDKLQLLQREGLITIDEKLNVNFTHRTFAEYLAAKWLSENVQSSKAQTLIKERFNKNYKFLFNMFDRFLAEDSPLHLSIINNKTDEAKAIIKSNPDGVTCRDTGGRSILHVIALYSVEFPLLFHKYANFYPSSAATKFLNLKPFELDPMLEIIEEIPDCKILDIKKDILGYNPLDYALANNSLAAAHKIYEKLKHSTINANINLNFKKSYLGYCTLLNYESLFTLLLPYFVSKDFLLKNVGGDVNVNTYFQNMYSNNAYTKSILNYKIDFGTMTILNLLQSKCAYSGYIKDHYSELHYTIIFNSIDNVEKLLNETTEINVQDQDNNTPLHYSALYGHKQISKMLLDKNAKVYLQNYFDDTALHIALRENQPDIARMLLESSANGNIRNKNGETPLHYAIQKKTKILRRKFCLRESLMTVKTVTETPHCT